MKEPTIYTRRNFLKTSILGSVSAWTIPAFLESTIHSLAAQTANTGIRLATKHDGTILVLIQLGGGNDGLNTIIPFTDDVYFNLRPTVAIRSNQNLNINDRLQFNPSMQGFKNLYDSGNLAVIQGVGYPNPNRSHFHSADIWTNGGRTESTGWIGRYFDSTCEGTDPIGIALSKTNPSVFKSDRSHSIVSFDNPNTLTFTPNNVTIDESLAFFKELNNGKEPHHEPTAEFLEKTALDTVLSMEKIKKATSASSSIAYPNSKLGQDLKYIAKMINEEFSTKIFYASQGGYDTHGSQLQDHNNKLSELSEAIYAFVSDLKSHNNFNRVVIMTFSEFGRRVAENGDKGTDHGAAAPMFIFGGGINPGIFGEHPSLSDLDHGDLKHGIDFRSVYATILHKWLGIGSEEILGQKFEQLDFL